MPLSHVEVAALVSDANTALSGLQAEFGRDNKQEARITFPRGFIRTASELRATLPNLDGEVQRRNASYALMTIDVLRWLIVRTDLAGTALSMVVKEKHLHLRRVGRLAYESRHSRKWQPTRLLTSHGPSPRRWNHFRTTKD